MNDESAKVLIRELTDIALENVNESTYDNLIVILFELTKIDQLDKIITKDIRLLFDAVDSIYGKMVYKDDNFREEMDIIKRLNEKYGK